MENNQDKDKIILDNGVNEIPSEFEMPTMKDSVQEEVSSNLNIDTNQVILEEEKKDEIIISSDDTININTNNEVNNTTKKEEKKSFMIPLIITAAVVGIVIFYIFFTITMAKVQIAKTSTELIKAVAANKYDQIRPLLKKEDGSDLTYKEITNYLYNSGLYRTIFSASQDFSYMSKVSIFNMKKGDVTAKFKSSDGTDMKVPLSYVSDKNGKYFVVSDLENKNPAKKRFNVSFDLATGQVISYNFDNPNDNSKFNTYTIQKDSDGQTFVEIYEDSIEDVKESFIRGTKEYRNLLISTSNNYNLEYNDDLSEIKIYKDDALSFYDSKLKFMMYAMVYQGLNGNEDWHLTLTYYKYDTKEILKQEVVR